MAGGCSGPGRLKAGSGPGWLEDRQRGGCRSLLPVTYCLRQRSGSWSWRQKPGKVSRGCCQFRTWGRTDFSRPRRLLICTWCACCRTCLTHPYTPARMRQAGPCQPTRSTAARVSVSAAGWAGRVPSADGPVA